MENKLIEEIESLLNSKSYEHHAMSGFNEASEKLFTLTSDVANAYATWKEEFVDYDDVAKDFYFMPNMVVKTEKELFAYFISNIYKQVK